MKPDHAASASTPKIEGKRVKLEATRKLDDRLEGKRMQEGLCKITSPKTSREVAQMKIQGTKSFEHVSLKPEGTGLPSLLYAGAALNKSRSKKDPNTNSSIISDKIARSNIQLSQLNSQLSQLEDFGDQPNSQLAADNLFTSEGNLRASVSSNLPAGPSQSDLDHWDMVAEACAGVLQKLDLEGNKEDARPPNNDAVLDFSTDFEFEDWTLSYSASQQNEWDENDDSDDDEWMYVADLGVQCSLTDEES